MNLVIKNQNYKILDNLTVDIIKTMTGEFSKENLEMELVNFVYNRAIIDITAISNYFDIQSVLNFLSFFDKDKVIILLNESDLTNSKSYLGKLVENGYYNFTKNAAGINYLIDNPNDLSKVASYTEPDNNVNNLNNFNSPAPSQMTAAQYQKNTNQKVIGIQNITEHAGATTLMYMMVKQLSQSCRVKGFELLKQDSIYFRENNIKFATSLEDLKIKIKECLEEKIIIVDLNGLDGNEICDEILYLIEPGIIRLNKLIKKDPNVSEKLINGKVILNRSSIKDDELSSFEYETKIRVFYNLVNFNDRKERIQVIDVLLTKLGLQKMSSNGGIFGIFK